MRTGRTNADFKEIKYADSHACRLRENRKPATLPYETQGVKRVTPGADLGDDVLHHLTFQEEYVGNQDGRHRFVYKRRRPRWLNYKTQPCTGGVRVFTRVRVGFPTYVRPRPRCRGEMP